LAQLKILLTGSNGFFGKAILPRLEHAGHRVIGADIHPKQNPNTEFLDVASQESCTHLFSKHPDIGGVVHCAAIAHASPGMIPESQYHRTNALGTRNIIDTAVDFGVQKFIMISTVSVYGEFDLPDIVRETTSTNPIGPYGTSKKAAEEYCLKKKHQIDLYIFRMTTMYGDNWLFNIRGKVVPPVIGKYVYIRMDSRSRRYSFCSNRNGADAVVWAIDNKKNPDTYNVADDCNYCLDTVLNVVKKKEGNKFTLSIPRFLPVVAMQAIIKFTRSNEITTNMKSRYWKFFKNNIYSTDKLKAAGFIAHPYLLDLEIDDPTIKSL
jgi:nucleoside-diphosphate-sugar epimerase